MAKSTKTKKTVSARPSTKAARLQRTKSAIDQEKHKPKLSKAGKAKRKEALRAARISRVIETKTQGFTGALPKLVVPYLIAEARRSETLDKPMMYSEGARQTLRVIGAQTLAELGRDCAMLLAAKKSRMLQAGDVYTAARLSRVLSGAPCMDPMCDVQATTAEHRFVRLNSALKKPQPDGASASAH